MGSRKRYRISNLQITLANAGRASWQFAGRTVHGHDHLYEVRDLNFPSLNNWTVAVRVPKRGIGSVVVQPRQVPGKRTWAGLDRRSLVFVRATRLPYRDRRYCKISLADPSGVRTKHTLSRGARSHFPHWLKQYQYRIRLKQTVALTKGNDGNALVAVVWPEDYPTMIRLYFALKVWVLEERFQI